MKVKCVCEAGLVVLRDATVLLTLWLVLNRDVENGNQPNVCVCVCVCVHQVSDSNSTKAPFRTGFLQFPIL